MTADRPDMHPSADSPEYDELLRMYGEAMLRISRLEAQVDRPQKGSVEDPSSEGGTPPAEDSRPEPADTVPKGGERSRDEGDISHLRLRIAALSNQLAVAQQKEAGHTEERASRRRRRRSDRRPIWMFWKRWKRYSKS